MIAKDTSNKLHWSMTLPSKGANEYSTKLLTEMVRETGHKEIQLGSDNEPASLALNGEVVKALPDVKLTPVEAQTGDHRSNCEAEVAVKEVKRQCRAILSTLEEKMKMKISDMHSIMAWIPRHAGFLMSRLRFGW